MKAMINIDPERTAAYVRNKAKKFGSRLIYIENGHIVAENPRTGIKKILQKSIHKLSR